MSYIVPFFMPCENRFSGIGNPLFREKKRDFWGFSQDKSLDSFKNAQNEVFVFGIFIQMNNGRCILAVL